MLFGKGGVLQHRGAQQDRLGGRGAAAGHLGQDCHLEPKSERSQVLPEQDRRDGDPEHQPLLQGRLWRRLSHDVCPGG